MLKMRIWVQKSASIQPQTGVLEDRSEWSPAQRPPPGAGLQYQLLFGFLLADLNTAGDMRVPGVPFHLFSFTVYTYISCSPLRFSFRSDAVSLSLRGEPPLPSDLEDNAALASLRFRKRAL